MKDEKVELTKEQIIENQMKELERLAEDNCFLESQLSAARRASAQLKEELRIAQSDNATLKEAIVSHFASDWGR